jgi:hypothetical protein
MGQRIPASSVAGWFPMYHVWSGLFEGDIMLKRNQEVKPQVTSKPRCGYCGGEPDHKHGIGHACGDCCAMHGGLTMPGLKHEYKWVSELFKKHVETLSEIDATKDELRRFKEEVRWCAFAIPSIVLLFLSFIPIFKANLYWCFHFSIPVDIIAVILIMLASKKKPRKENKDE